MGDSVTLGSIEDTAGLAGSDWRIPRLGFGVYRSAAAVCAASTGTALAAGYRHVDTAQFYRNEAEVGAAVAASGLARSAVFITTKILSAGGSVEASLQKCRESVAKLDPGKDGRGGYVDLFLIHNSNAGPAVRRELWAALERLKAEGLARDIGVSNYGIGHIEEMRAYSAPANWPPAANQIELHPWCQQREVVEYCRGLGIAVQAYSPLTRMQRAYEPVLVEIAERYRGGNDRAAKKTTHVLIRYALQKGWIPLVKSDDPGRIRDNADVFDFALTEADMRQLDAQDQGVEGAIVQAVHNDV